MASFLNTLPRPVRTLVAVMKRWIGDCASTSKSMSSARISRKRILAHRIQVVGRHQARHEIHRDIDRRGIERPAAENHVERPALERAEAGGVRDAPPEGLERLARAGRPALLMAVDQHRGVHRARGCPGDAVDLEPGLFQQTIEHAPGERAMRAAALQREIDEDGLRAIGLFASVGISHLGLGPFEARTSYPRAAPAGRIGTASARSITTQNAPESREQVQLLILSARRDFRSAKSDAIAPIEHRLGAADGQRVSASSRKLDCR